MMSGEVHQIITRSDSETIAEARAFAAALCRGDCVALTGELGAGKTQWVRGICEFFHCEKQMSSPTFTIINEYEGDLSVAHCDLYRLRSVMEAFDAGVTQLFDGERLVLLEWAEKIIDSLPIPRYEIVCEHGENEHDRLFRWQHCTDANASILINATAAR